jgi:uncharacterized protein YndB with AHSA1/START domain
LNDADQNASTVAVERLISASPRAIFAAFENADRLAQWWGPAGFTNTFEHFEFTPGGRWIYAMHGPDGRDYPNECIFSEIEPGIRIVIDHVVLPRYTLTITLTPDGGKTLLTWKQIFENTAVVTSMRSFLVNANNENLDRLEAVLAEPVARRQLEFSRGFQPTERIKKASVTQRRSNIMKRELLPEDREELLNELKTRFEENMARHKGLEWANVLARLEADPAKLWPLSEMERTGGEPDVVGFDATTGEYIFYDCSAESPKGRRSLCYDRMAWESRKEHKPANDAVSMAAARGIDILTEEQYRELQTLGEFDLKTSSWVKTPAEVRDLGGAIFCDRRFGRIFTYHNGAESYYAARGFRSSLRI